MDASGRPDPEAIHLNQLTAGSGCPVAPSRDDSTTLLGGRLADVTVAEKVGAYLHSQTASLQSGGRHSAGAALYCPPDTGDPPPPATSGGVEFVGALYPTDPEGDRR